MQLIQLVQTTHWMQTRLEPGDRFVFSVFDRVLEVIASSGKSETEGFLGLLKSAMEVRDIQRNLLEHPPAEQVLRAFDLGPILNPEAPELIFKLVADREHVLARVYKDPGSYLHRGDAEQIHRSLLPFQRLQPKWNRLKDCVYSVEALTVPKVVVEAQAFDDILTLEIRVAEPPFNTAANVAEVLTFTNRLYEATALAVGEEVSPLSIIFANSGSPIRFDMTGTAKTVLAVKELLLALWGIRKFSSLTVQQHELDLATKQLAFFEDLRKRVRAGAISQMEADSIRGNMIVCGVKLIDRGALPREVPDTEVVSTTKLIEVRSAQKLLSAPKLESGSPPSATDEPGGSSATFVTSPLRRTETQGDPSTSGDLNSDAE